MREVKRQVNFSGRHLEAGTIFLEKDDGSEIEWEFTARKGNKAAVNVCARIKPNKAYPNGGFILIKQYRPPVGAETVEFPAGMIDDGDDVGSTVFREFAEETGYRVTEAKITGPFYSSPGMSAEQIYHAEVEVNLDSPLNKSPQQNLQGAEENMEVILLPYEDAKRFVATTPNMGAKAAAYILGCM